MHALAPYIDLIKAAILGVVEGLTEFLPVSSTGHLLLMEHFLGWGDDAFGKSFAILIQLGAILALLSIYFGRIWSLATNMFSDWDAARFVIGVLLAFLPAAVIGVLAAPFIKAHLSTCASSASCSSSVASCCSASTG
jgi:undecaprenyl-diphosphatase